MYVCIYIQVLLHVRVNVFLFTYVCVLIFSLCTYIGVRCRCTLSYQPVYVCASAYETRLALLYVCMCVCVRLHDNAYWWLYIQVFMFVCLYIKKRQVTLTTSFLWYTHNISICFSLPSFPSFVFFILPLHMFPLLRTSLPLSLTHAASRPAIWLSRADSVQLEGVSAPVSRARRHPPLVSNVNKASFLSLSLV